MLTGQDAKARGKTPIKDLTIKILQDKSLVQTNQHHIRPHPLVARFAKNKVNPEEESYYLQAIFEFQLSFVRALRELNRNYDLAKQMLAKKITHTQINNFCFMLEKLNPTFNQQDIIGYTHELSLLLSKLDIFQASYDALKLSINLFEKNAELYRYLQIELLTYRYYLGDFDTSYTELQQLLHVEKWLTLDADKQIERCTFASAASVYGNEGMTYELVVYRKKNSLTNLSYDWALVHIGIFNLKLAQVCIQNTDSLYVKWALGTLKLQELNSYLASLHPKAHIQLANALILKAKLTPLGKEEIIKLVVVNPYTQGVKHLLNAIHCENAVKAKRLFQQALPELEHIKFAYTEALLEYASWLDKQNDAEFDFIYNQGLASAKKYHYRFLHHSFLRLKTALKTPYNEADYPLPNNDDYSAYIEQTIKSCIKKN